MLAEKSITIKRSLAKKVTGESPDKILTQEELNNLSESQWFEPKMYAVIGLTMWIKFEIEASEN